MAVVAVIGCGAWATTAAKLIAENGHHVRIWCHRDTYAQTINATHQNAYALPNVTLPKQIHAETAYDKTLDSADAIVFCLASPYIEILSAFKPFYVPGVPVISLCKGLTPNGERISTAVQALLESEQEVAILSGPNLASEVAAQKPSATVVAHPDETLSDIFQTMFNRPYFRVYTSYDSVGVEYGGILKNIMAIGTGIIDGLELGDNARAAFITRALKEIKQWGVHNGAQPETFNGLSGLGDLIATCSSSKSRNWKAGYAIATTGQLPDAGSAVVEGVRTTQLLYEQLTSPSAVAAYPIISTIYSVLFESKHPNDALYDLMNRDLKHE